MQIIRDLDFQLNNTAVCIGKFDGIHRGHRLLLEEAEKSGLTIVMFTFAAERGVLYGEQEKIALAARLGVDVFLVIPFDRHFQEQTAEQFVKNILLVRCGAKKLLSGTISDLVISAAETSACCKRWERNMGLRQS